MPKILVEDHIFSNYEFPSQTLHKKFLFFSDFTALSARGAAQPQILTHISLEQRFCATWVAFKGPGSRV